MKESYDLVVIGGGPAGMAAACEAKAGGLERVAILEQDARLGGILNQCIHSGFGLHNFGEELTGPEYAWRSAEAVRAEGIDVFTDTALVEMDSGRRLFAVSKTYGALSLEAESVVLATGCRERTRDAVGIPGTRPAGVLTAGAAQQYVNIEGYMVGRRVVILGSGDIGLIMARRMTLEGAKVLACIELRPYSNGLPRNITQCLDDFDIPLLLSHTVTEIRGRKRLEGVMCAAVDENARIIPGTEEFIPCDTLLLSVGLIPENTVAQRAGVQLDGHTGAALVDEALQTSLPGVFACGNALHVHDLADDVSREGRRAGRAACAYVRGQRAGAEKIVSVKPGSGVAYVLPQLVHIPPQTGEVEFNFRVSKPFGKCRVVFADESGSLSETAKPRLLPSEMVRAVLSEKQLQGVSGDITLSIVPLEEE